MRVRRVALAAALTGALTAGARWMAEPSAPQPRVRVHLQRPVAVDCPTDHETEDLLAELLREQGLVEREADGLARRTESLGAALPDDLPEAVTPGGVMAAVNRLRPAGADLVWGCDEVPCSGALVLDPSDPDAATRAEAFQAAMEAAYPRSASPPMLLDPLAHPTTEPAHAAGLVVMFTVTPHLTEPAHRARLYYLSRASRDQLADALRDQLRPTVSP